MGGARRGGWEGPGEEGWEGVRQKREGVGRRKVRRGDESGGQEHRGAENQNRGELGWLEKSGWNGKDAQVGKFMVSRGQRSGNTRRVADECGSVGANRNTRSGTRKLCKQLSNMRHHTR